MVLASTLISRRGKHAKVVGTPSMEALTRQPIDITGLKRWQGTGFAPLGTAELTTMQADPTATDVVHLKMIILLDMGVTWPVLEDMDLIAVLHQDGKVGTGFAQG